jgi:hypothetical protein
VTQIEEMKMRNGRRTASAVMGFTVIVIVLALAGAVQAQTYPPPTNPPTTGGEVQSGTAEQGGAVASAGQSGGGSTGGLAFTGAEIGLLVLGTVVLAGVGALAFVAARRRSARAVT